MKRIIFLMVLVMISIPAVSADGLCPTTGIRCVQNQESYEPGDHVVLSTRMCNNHETEPLPGDLYLILEVYDCYFFYPTWSQALDYIPRSVPPCSCSELVFLDFIAPEEMSGIQAFSAFVLDNLDCYFCEFNL